MSQRIFISHSHEDNAWVESFADELNKFDVIVWLDRVGLRGGDHWVDSIQSELTRSDIFLVVVTPASLASRWVREEINAALNLGKTVISLIHISAPLPPFLATRHAIDANGESPYQAALLVSSHLGVRSKADVQRSSPKLLEYAEIGHLDEPIGQLLRHLFDTHPPAWQVATFVVCYTRTNGAKQYQPYNDRTHVFDPVVDSIPGFTFDPTFFLNNDGLYSYRKDDINSIIRLLTQQGWVEIAPGQSWYNRRLQREVS